MMVLDGILNLLWNAATDGPVSWSLQGRCTWLNWIKPDDDDDDEDVDDDGDDDDDDNDDDGRLVS